MYVPARDVHRQRQQAIHVYHPLSTVSGRFRDQYGNPIFFPYLSSTSLVRKWVIKLIPDSLRYELTDSPCLKR